MALTRIGNVAVNHTLDGKIRVGVYFLNNNVEQVRVADLTKEQATQLMSAITGLLDTEIEKQRQIARLTARIAELQSLLDDLT